MIKARADKINRCGQSNPLTLPTKGVAMPAILVIWEA